MERKIRNKPASIRAKLMNIARAESVDFDTLLLRYFQRFWGQISTLDKLNNKKLSVLCGFA